MTLNTILSVVEALSRGPAIIVPMVREVPHGLRKRRPSRYSVFIMFRHLAMHDMLHAYRIEELLLKKNWAEEKAVS